MKNVQDFELLVLVNEWVSVICLEETRIMGDRTPTWPYGLKTDMMENHNEVPLHASQDGCYPKVYKQ